MPHYWIPQYRWQLIQALNQLYPKGKFQHMKKAQLYAIYHKLRKEGVK